MTTRLLPATLLTVITWLGVVEAATIAGEDDELLRKITAAQVPVQHLAEPLRSKVIDLLEKPTTYARGPAEAFPCQPGIYDWLLDNPHWGFRAWRALGVKCANVDKRDDGSFHGVDPQGSEMRWQCIHSEPGRHVWYAEGTGKTSLISPNLNLRVLVVLHHQGVRGSDGRIGVRHRAELFAQYDGSKASTWAMKLYGLSADAVGKKAVEQIGLFFSGLSWYVSENPTWARSFFKAKPQERTDEIQQLALLLQFLPEGADSQKQPVPPAADTRP